MVGKFASTDGATGDDAGVIHARILAKTDLGASGTLLRLGLPISAPHAPLGQFFLARPCADDGLARRTHWSLYARRPLYVADRLPQPDQEHTEWRLLLPHADPMHEDAGDRWIRSQPPDVHLNLTGPFGRAIAFAPHQRTLLVVADLRHLLLCLPPIHHLLDQGGRATLILHTETAPPAAILQRIPIPVEVRTTADLAALQRTVADTLRWADTMLVALPQLSTTWLSQAIRLARFRLEPDFAHVYMQADYLCGYGACLACAVASGDGYTRACQHGPFLSLDTLSS